MLAKGYGRIINTASMASLLVPHPQKQVRRRVLSTLFVPCTLGRSCPHDCKARRDVACYATQWVGHASDGLLWQVFTPGALSIASPETEDQRAVPSAGIPSSAAEACAQHTACTKPA